MTTHSTFQHAYGPWALVAGGARGIGAAFAEYIAARGINLIVVDIEPESLARFTCDLAQRYGIETLGIQLDLSASDMLARLADAVGSRDVGMLIYNAALADVGPFFKADSGLEHELHKIAINVTGPLTLIHHFAQPMLRRGRGGIILMSSGTGLMGAPYYAHYGATKAYNINLAEGLFHEFRSSHVDVLACIAGMTRSSSADAFLARGDGTELNYQSCEELVEEAMAALGKQPSLICGEQNRQSMAALLSLPREKALGYLAAHAVHNFLEGQEPFQHVGMD